MESGRRTWPERRRRGDISDHIGRNEVHFRRKHRQVQDRFAVRTDVDRVDLANLYPAHLHLGVGVHHQTGSWRNHGHRDVRGEVAPE